MLLPMSMEPWIAISKGLPQCVVDTSSCPGPYPIAAYPQCHSGHWLDREIFTLPSYMHIYTRLVSNNNSDAIFTYLAGPHFNYD